MRQDFLLQPYKYAGSDQVVWDFPLDDFYENGVLQTTPYGDSDEQHKIDIEVNSIGSIKQFPLLGFNLFTRLNSENTTNLYQDLTENMKMDGYKVGTGAIKFTGKNGFTIDNSKITPSY